jgi:predicted DNA-binding transcriptional regulator YafY
MKDVDYKRIARLTAILTQLQSRRLTRASVLASKFSVSIRTIYRDMKTLEEAGIPILTQEGKGYMLVEGFRLPPVMFDEVEANALITAEHLVYKSNDSSLQEAYSSAMQKIQAVLTSTLKEKTEALSGRISVSPQRFENTSSSSLMLIQNALTSRLVLDIIYESGGSKHPSSRQVEPFAFYFSLEENWLLIAFCRLRKEFRMFRLDRILKLDILAEHFEPHQLTLEQYLKEKQKKFITPDIPLS